MIIGHIILPKKKKKSQRYHKIILILDILITQVIHFFFFWVLIIGYLVLSSYIRQSSINYIFLHNIHVILSLLDSKTGQKYLKKKKNSLFVRFKERSKRFSKKKRKKKKKERENGPKRVHTSQGPICNVLMGVDEYGLLIDWVGCRFVLFNTPMRYQCHFPILTDKVSDC